MVPSLNISLIVERSVFCTFWYVLLFSINFFSFQLKSAAASTPKWTRYKITRKVTRQERLDSSTFRKDVSSVESGEIYLTDRVPIALLLNVELLSQPLDIWMNILFFLLSHVRQQSRMILLSLKWFLVKWVDGFHNKIYGVCSTKSTVVRNWNKLNSLWKLVSEWANSQGKLVTEFEFCSSCVEFCQFWYPNQWSWVQLKRNKIP